MARTIETTMTAVVVMSNTTTMTARKMVRELVLSVVAAAELEGTGVALQTSHTVVAMVVKTVVGTVVETVVVETSTTVLETVVGTVVGNGEEVLLD